MAEETDLEKCNFRNFRSSCSDLDLELRSGRDHTLVEVYRNIYRNREKNFLWTDVRRTYGWTDRPEFQFIRSSLGDDL